MNDGSVPHPGSLALSRKEDFKAFAESPRRSRPDLLTRKQLKSLPTQARADYDRQRRQWHANIGPVKTPQLTELHEDLWDIVDSNEQDGDKAKGAVAVDAFPGLGKTTSVEKCGEAFVAGIEARKSHIYCPGWVGLFRWLKPLLSTRFGEALTAKDAPELMPKMDAEVAALGRSMSARTEALEKH